MKMRSRDYYSEFKHFDKYAKQIDSITDFLKKMNLRFLESETKFVFIDCNKSGDAVFMNLMKQGVIIRPLVSFGLPSAIRVTVGTQSQNEIFIRALKKVL